VAKETVTASWSPAHFDLNQLLTLSHQLLGFVSALCRDED
jgi:hypothetical protein